jgi:hypothetical protein
MKQRPTKITATAKLVLTATAKLVRIVSRGRWAEMCCLERPEMIPSLV